MTRPARQRPDRPGARQRRSDLRSSQDSTGRRSGGGHGADEVKGGPGIDWVGYFYDNDNDPLVEDDNRPIDVEVTLDDQANDGQRGGGEGDNIHSDVENVTTGAGNDRLVGSDQSNELRSGNNNDEIDGGGGVDIVDAGNGDDRIAARDLTFDDVDCGRGNDAVVGDNIDRLIECEGLDIASVPGPVDTTKPVLAFAGGSVVSDRSFAKSRTISVTATTSEPAAFNGDLLARGKIAAIGDLVLANGRLGLGAGTRTLKIKVGKANAKRILSKARSRKLKKKGYSMTVALTVTDPSGNATTARKKVTVKVSAKKSKSKKKKKS